MKKPLILLALAILIVIGGLLGYLYLNANELIARVKPELEKIASNALGAPVTIGSIDLGIGLQPTISIAQVDIGAEAKTETKKHFSVGNVLLSIDLIPLLSKELRVTKLTIEKPHVTAIKTSEGIQIAGLPKKNAGQGAQTQPKIPDDSPRSLPLAFALENFTLTDGSLSLSDQTKVGPLADLQVTDLSVSSGLKVSDSNIELAESVITALLNQTLPIKVSAQHISLNPKTLDATLEKIVIDAIKTTFFIDGAVNLTHMKGKFILGSNGLNLSELVPLTTFVPALKLFPLSGTVNPDLTLTLGGASQYDLSGTAKLNAVATTINSFQLSDLNGVVNITANPREQTITAAEPLLLRFQEAPISVAFLAGLRGTIGFLENLKLSAFSGNITGKADSSLIAPQAFHTQLDLTSLSIEQALAAFTGKAESPLNGTLESVNINLEGELGTALKTTTAGRINVRVKDALLKQVNIAFEAFRGILSLPFIAGRLEGSLPPEMQQELTATDTKIKSITTSLHGDKGTFTTNDFILVGSFFTVRGKGEMSMNGAVNIASSISFNEHFTKLLVERVKQLKAAVDRNGELTFPLAISGIAPALTIVPDMDALAKLGVEALARDGAEKLIDKALGGKGGPGAAKEIGKLFGF